MPIKLKKDQLNQYKEKRQELFNRIVEAGDRLGEQWLLNGFDPLKTDGLRDVRMADEWYPFINSEYYRLYNELIIPMSITDTPFPGNAFKLFTRAFDTDYQKDVVTYKQSSLICNLNGEIGRHLENLVFEYKPVEIASQSADIILDDVPLEQEKSRENHSLLTTVPNPIKDVKVEKVDSAQRKKENIEKQGCFLSGISMQVLGGFLAVAGVASVALAFAVLNAASFGLAGVIVTSIGIATALTGLGFFAAGTVKKCSEVSEPEISLSVSYS